MKQSIGGQKKLMRKDGIFFNVCPLSKCRYEEVFIGEPTEITVFDGYFENMYSEHNEIPCTVICIGHYEFKINSWFPVRGFTEIDAARKTYILGINYCPGCNMDFEDAYLTKAAINAYIAAAPVQRDEPQIEKLKSPSQPRLPLCPTGYADTVKDFWTQFVEPMLPEKEVALAWHNILMKYVSEPDAVFVIRAFHNVDVAARRGFLTKTNQGYSFFYSDNSFATYIAKMVYDGFVPDYAEFKNAMLTRKFPAGWFCSTDEKRIAAYPLDSRLNPQIAASGYKLAHIVDSGNHFCIKGNDWNKAKICDRYFPAGELDDWKICGDESGRFYVRNLDVPEEARDILTAHFLRYTDPLNYFLTPKAKNNGSPFHYTEIAIPKNDIAEFETLQLYAMQKFSERFTSVYEDFLAKLMLCPKQEKFMDFANAGSSIIKIHYGENCGNMKITGAPKIATNTTESKMQNVTGGHKIIEYSFSRLCFKANLIEPLDMDDVFICSTPEGKFRMTKRQFYDVFANVVTTSSYRDTRIYHYKTTPQKAYQFLMKE